MYRPKARFGRFLRLAGWTVAALAVSLSPLLASEEALSPEAPAKEPPVRLKELYVPYEQFRALTRHNPDGVIMALSEYRELVRAALNNLERGEQPPTPPLEAVVTQATYEGDLSGNVVRLRGRLTIHAAKDDWVSCDLGPPLPSLGSVRVDGKAGWIVTRGGRSKGSAARALLLLRGQGEHTATITFALPVQEVEDWSKLAGNVVPASSASLDLSVPYGAQGRAIPDFLETREEQNGTRFHLALGKKSLFQLEWRKRKGFGESPVLLAAEHRIVYLPHAESPIFTWDAVVSVARHKTDELLFREPRGVTVVRAEGPLLHSWKRTSEGLTVVLKEPVLGGVVLRFAGLFTVEAESRFHLGAPALQNGYVNRGFLGVLDPGQGKLSVKESSGLVELDQGAVTLPPILRLVEHGVMQPVAGRSPVLRLYSFASEEARLSAQIIDEPLHFETRSAYLARIREGKLTLSGYVQVQVRTGRTYKLSLNLPEGWKLGELKEAPSSGRSPRGLRYELVDDNERRSLRLILERAASSEHPLELQLTMEYEPYRPEREWERREVSFELPSVAGAERMRTELGISLHASLYLGDTELTGWQTLSPEEAQKLGLDRKATYEEQVAARLAAGLWTEQPKPRVVLDLVHRPARGEYRAVTHVLAAERAHRDAPNQHALRVRGDIRLAIVDRGIDSLVVRHPVLPMDVTVVVLGQGIKEVRADNASGTQTVRFVRPWLGTRQLRVEYQIAGREGEEVSLASLSLDGDYGSERFVVLQSQGSVEVQSSPGQGIAEVDVDDLPDFAEPWANGRILKAYRYRSSESPGALRTVIHKRAPVLARLAREMTLVTVVGADGSERTRAEIQLSYSREQSLRIALPQQAHCLAVTVNGDPIRALRADDSARMSAKKVFAIPLPPRSYATIAVLYENRKRPVALGREGTWQEEGPILPDIPVGETTWTIYHPEGYRWYVTGGNLRADSPELEERIASFAASFFGRIFSGRMPIFTVFRRERPARDLGEISLLTPEESLGARGQSGQADGQSRQGPSRLAPQQGVAQQRIRTSTAYGAPLHRLIPEGRQIALRKFGGDPALELTYVRFDWWSFSKRCVFAATLLISLLLYLRTGTLAVSLLLFWGLLLGTLFPHAVSWESPLLLIPFCEALVLVALLVGLRTAGQGLCRLWRRWRGVSSLASTAGVLLLLVGQLVLVPVSGLAGEAEKAPKAKAPFDAVLVPYDAEAPPWKDGDGERKAFVPKKRFQELWKLAHPESDAEEPEDEEIDLPYDLALGDATYSLRFQGDGYRLTGTVPLYLFTKRWVLIPLHFDRAQLVRVVVDGQEMGVAQHGSLPALELRGRGEHRIELELAGKVHRDLGELSVTTSLLKGAAATVAAELPKGAEVDTQKTSPGATITESGDRVKVIVDVGAASQVRLLWSFPEIEGQLASQLESFAYSSLNLTTDGFDVSRLERLRIAGRPVEKVTYRVLGSWQITEVTGAHVTEWSVTRSTDEEEVIELTVFFAEPVSQTRFWVSGRAVMESAGELTALELIGAVRQETFVGLSHGGRRRFLQDVLSGMRRASFRELSRFVSPTKLSPPDRIYQIHGSGAGEALSLTGIEANVQLVTDLVAYVRVDRLLVFCRSRYARAESGPLRHVVALPKGITVRKVQCEDLRSWEVLDADDGRRLVVHMNGRAAAGREVIWSGEQVLSEPPERLPLPAPRFLAEEPTRLEETVHWVVAADDELQLRASETHRLEPLALEAAPAWVRLPEKSSYRFAYRSRRDDARLGLRAVPSPSKLGAVIVSFARLAEEYLYVNTRIIYRIRFSGRDSLRLRLPRGAELVYADTKNQRSQVIRTTDAGAELAIHLQSPARDGHAVDLLYRMTREDGRSPILQPIAVFDEDRRLAEVDQYVAVLQTARTFTLETEAVGLSPVEAETFPHLLRGISKRSLGLTYRGTSLEWSLRLREQEIEVLDRLDAIVKLADISTRIGHDGTVRTQVVYTLLNQSLQFLAVQLPKGADLWGVTVNGRPVAVGRKDRAEGVGNPRTRSNGSDVLQIPVEHVGRSQLPLEVAITYEEPGTDLPAMRSLAGLSSPRLLKNQAVRIVQTIWSVQVPEGYRVTDAAGRMRPVPQSLKHAEKLQGLLKQQKTVIEAARTSDSKRAKERAGRELARIEQALGDNLAELRGTDRKQELAQQDLIGERDLKRQWTRNKKIVDEAVRAQSALRAELEKQKQEAQRPTESRDEEAFNDRANFLRGRAWRGGKRAAARAKSEPRAAEGPAPDGLLEKHPFPGWDQVAAGAVGQEADVASPVPVDASLGLKPLRDVSRLGTSPGLKLSDTREGYVTYAFRRSDGDAELALEFTQHVAFERLAAWALLVLGIGGFFWLRKRAAGEAGGR
ncbi:hypothetical protein ACFL59_00815 [Planctomycetota bacterium]